MNTGEDTQALRKIADYIRLVSVIILALHCYIMCYAAFDHWQLSTALSDRIMVRICRLSLFQGLWKAKMGSLVCLIISLIGTTGRKDEKIRLAPLLWPIAAGLLFYCSGTLAFYLPIAMDGMALAYMLTTFGGYLLILAGGARLSRLIKNALDKDIFNHLAETFPQEERLLENEFSVNLPAQYQLGRIRRNSWINLINPFRGTLVAGTPGAGKSYFVIRHIIDQHLSKGFSMFIYDFKFDDLSRIAYNKLLQYRNRYPIVPQFFVINFDDLDRTHRCNPLDPQTMEDITDATEASRTIMLGLNRDWIKKQGDFFVESPINFLTAIIWFLRRYENGRYCTLPHVIELMQTDYDELFAILYAQEEIRVLINPFISAWQNKATAQLEGQIASAKIGLARLSSPALYYVMSGNDFSLDINSPEEPKVVCMGNNPQKLQVYGAILSLYISRMVKLVNRKGQLKSSLIFDEFPTIYFGGIDSLIATARSNKVATTLAVQDFSQLKKDYGSEQAEVITGIVGNIVSGQVTGDTAKKLSESFGKIMQDRQSRSVNSTDISISQSNQLEYAIPAAKIASLSSGTFVGITADSPDQKIHLKLFHSEIQNDHEAIAIEEKAYLPIPVIQGVSEEDVRETYLNIKREIRSLLRSELDKLRTGQETDREDRPIQGEGLSL